MELLGKTELKKRNTESTAHLSGLSRIIPLVRTETGMPTGKCIPGTFIPQVHGDADYFIPLINKQGSGNGGVHPAAHTNGSPHLFHGCSGFSERTGYPAGCILPCSTAISADPVWIS